MRRPVKNQNLKKNPKGVCVARQITETAPAKVNLCLHVTGQRADGYHLLDSLVVFARVGDKVHLRPANDFSLKISGPMAPGLTRDDSNLVLRAARALHDARGGDFSGVELELEKNLPLASGIGGGSADAAAALRGVQALYGSGGLSEEQIAEIALTLGADVPVCLGFAPVRMRGIGEKIDLVPPLPACHIVLVNPGVEVATRLVFSALAGKFSSGLDPMPTCPFASAGDLCAWLKNQRNDLQPPAVENAPQIDDVLKALKATSGVLLARMSGSGATCFGLYASASEAQRAAETISRRAKNWWVAATHILPGHEL
jgi:4-diphosphocytidyl-2-C-methyl-D-erythritol kinase